MLMPLTNRTGPTFRPSRIARRALVYCCLALAATAASSETLSWFRDGQPTAAAREAVALLAAAATDGLDPTDYNASTLHAALAASGKSTGAPQTELEQSLTVAMQRFLLDIRCGRIDPLVIDENFTTNTNDWLDPDRLLREALSAQQVAPAVAAARPPLAQYERLREALARYRMLENDPTWLQRLPPLPGPSLPGRKLEPGQPWAGVTQLMQRLERLGDLASGTPVPPRYEGAAVAGVQAFQQRHGLTPDGVIGKGTLDALEVTPGSRARQIELALERLRWTPHPERAVIVNVPEFVVRGYDARDGRSAERVAMNIIVGNAAKTQTPIFDATMRYIEFSPYWNVPPSIARGETIPKLRRDPAYFEQQGFEFVSRDGQLIGHLSEANIAAVRSGQMRIRQRPGTKNALGDIKFVFPNADNIYLHHTPTPKLFKRDRRDFSHGCIRVEQPVELAKFILASQPEWDEERIVQAMTRGKSATLQLNEPLSVVIAYRTVSVSDGKVHFFADLYGRDARLRDALAARKPLPAASESRENTL